MKLEKLINILGDTLEKTLVIKRELKADTTFKAYKTYKITLYEVVPKSIPREICEYQITDKIIESNKETIIAKTEEEFIKKLFEVYVYRD